MEIILLIERTNFLIVLNIEEKICPNTAVSVDKGHQFGVWKMRFQFGEFSPLRFNISGDFQFILAVQATSLHLWAASGWGENRS